MSSRYVPNEAACPVHVELLGLLLRSPEARVVEIVEGQSPQQRAELALYCAQRAHMRDLALLVAARCTEASLLQAAGLAGEILYEQARTATAASGTPKKKKITLARAA